MKLGLATVCPRPSPQDLRAVGVIVEMAEASGKPFVFEVDGATPRTTIALEALRALAQHGKVAPVTCTSASTSPPARSADAPRAGSPHKRARPWRWRRDGDTSWHSHLTLPQGPDRAMGQVVPPDPDSIARNREAAVVQAPRQGACRRPVSPSERRTPSH
jgi:hypothetical protein